MLSGQVEHEDSLGNKGVIGPGDVQWMTAGSGIIHQEMPQRCDDRLRGFQLWVNLPAASKMTEPRYQGIAAADIPRVAPAVGVDVSVIAGEYDGTAGAVTDVVADPLYLDVRLDAGVVFNVETRREHRVLAYVVEGAARFEVSNAADIGAGNVVLYADGDGVAVRAGERGARFLFLSGMPIDEPVEWYGPVVMNTKDEVMKAFDEYEKGTFVK